MLNFTRATSILLSKELRTLYPSRWSIVAHGLAELLTIILYWYTAKALSPKLEFSDRVGSDYFLFVMVGELTLLVPSTLLYSFSKALKEIVNSQMLSSLAVQPFSRAGFLLHCGAVAALVKLLQMMLTLLLLYSLFSFSLPLWTLLKMMFVVFLSLPIFVGLGLLAAAIVLRFGRGEGVIMMISSASYVVAGVYFPTAVFPSHFEKIVNLLSPFNVLLQAVRKLTTNSSAGEAIGLELLVLLVMALFFMVAGYSACRYAFKSLIKRKKPLIF